MKGKVKVYKGRGYTWEDADSAKTEPKKFVPKKAEKKDKGE